MEEEVDEVVGPRGEHDSDRVAVRHGHEAGEVTLGARRLAVERPRARSPDGGDEVPLRTYGHFASRDPLTDLVFERIMAGVSCRRYERTNEPVGEEIERDTPSTSKSAVSREFVARTRANLEALMVDGIELKGGTNVVALGITTDGVRIALGLWEGSTENATVATALLGPGRPWPGCRAGDPVRHRRRQGASQGDPGGLRRGRAGAALPTPQCAQSVGTACRGGDRGMS